MSRASVIAAATAFAIAAPFAAPAGAHDYGQEIAKRQQTQLDRISEGRKDGSLTWLEAHRLRKEQRRIAELVRNAGADGRLTITERRQIRDAQSSANRHIWSERHDLEVRGLWWRITH
jgi:hypothetical protein